MRATMRAAPLATGNPDISARVKPSVTSPVRVWDPVLASLRVRKTLFRTWLAGSFGSVRILGIGAAPPAR